MIAHPDHRPADRSTLTLSETGSAAQPDERPDGSQDERAVPAVAGPAPKGVVEFGPLAYLETYPDVTDAIAAGTVASAVDHYARFGRAGHRLAQPRYLYALAGGVTEKAAHGVMSFTIDVAIASVSGSLFVVGWSDDRETPLLSVSAIQADEGWNTRSLGRFRRRDVEDLLKAPASHSYGFWFVHKLGRFDRTGQIMLRARFADGRFTQTELNLRIMTEADLRETILGHFASLQYSGNRDVEASRSLDSGIGAELVTLNRSISQSIKALAHVERYGPARTRFAASFIICLLGRAEYFFVQNALFALGRGVADIEFIYVCNSPELTEALQKEARIGERIYGLSVTLVTLTGNAGFSAANNVAAQFARSDRVVFVNPDVFPRDEKWAQAHGEIVDSGPRSDVALFGAPLFYDDGSLMHGGIYFEIDRGLSVTPARIEARGLVRVEHYGKGAPDWATRYTKARPVPAVTGAFISADRKWFEALGGFNEDYIFGHYEDADLCLRSLERGVPAWIHDVRFWHLEGKGSVRRPPHEGGSMVNRWLFTSRWAPMIEASLLGRSPRHPLLAGHGRDVMTSAGPETGAAREPRAPATETILYATHMANAEPDLAGWLASEPAA